MFQHCLTLLLLILLLAVTPTTNACTVLDISSSSKQSTATILSAQYQARQLLEQTSTTCVTVLLTGRTFTQALALTALDNRTRWIGGTFTDAIDIPSSAWTTTTTAPNQHSLNLTHFNVLAAHLGDDVSTHHFQLLVQMPGTKEWRPMMYARWPNIPFQYKEVPPVNWTKVGTVPDDPQCGLQCRRFTWSTQTNRPMRWVQAAAEGRLYLQGLFKYMWRDNRVGIDRVDVKTRQLSTQSSTIGIDGVFPGALYFAYGMSLFEELDSPGEFAIDANAMTLSAIVPGNCVDANRQMICQTRAVVVVPDHASATKNTQPGQTSLLSIRNAKDIQMTNMTVMGSSRKVGVDISQSSNIHMKQCTFNNLVKAIDVDVSHNISLCRSSVGFTMETAVSLNDGGDPSDGSNRILLTSNYYLIENNVFQNFGRWGYTYQSGVEIARGAVGVVVRRNLFHSCYHAALLFGGNDHVFELNEFRNVVTMGYDSGAIYGGRDLSSRGVKMINNYFHHINHLSLCNAETSCIRAAIYVDDFQGGVTVSGNIFYKVFTSFFSNQGGDFNFDNNLFVEVGTTIRQAGADESHGFGMVGQTLFDRLHLVPFANALWYARYPVLKNRFQTWNNGSQPPPRGTNEPLDNVYAMNCVTNVTGPVPVPGSSHFHNFTANAKGMFSLPSPYYTPNAANTSTWFNLRPTNQLLSHPGFAVDASPDNRKNFSLKSTSPLWKLGWKKIPQDQIGPDWVG